MKLDQALVTSATGAATVALALALADRPHPRLSGSALIAVELSIGALGGLAACALASYLRSDERKTREHERKLSYGTAGAGGRGLMDYPGGRELDATGGAM